MTVCGLAIYSTPHVWIFQALQLLQLVPSLLVTLVPFLIIIALPGLAILVDIITWVACKCIKVNHDKLPSCYKKIKSFRLYLTNIVRRVLCPLMFPGLFTKHKMRAQAQESSPKVYIVFLNRNLNDHFVFLLVFSLLSLLVLAASATAFLTSFSPVPTGAQCLEEDKFGHSLLCYADDSAYPENCSNSIISFYALLMHTDNSDYLKHYTHLTTLEANITYTCYPWTIRIFAVAFASAMGVFKFAIFFTTAYVQICDWCLRNCSSPCKIGRICKWTVMIGLGLSGVICLLRAFYSLGTIMSNRSPNVIAELLTKISELCEYTYLPAWLCLGLAVVTWYLEEHCKQAEFNTLSPDQLPPPSSPLPQEESQPRSPQVIVET